MGVLPTVVAGREPLAAAKNVHARIDAGGSGGKIVLMSSARGLLGHPAGYTAYCASKSAVDGITKGELAAYYERKPSPEPQSRRKCVLEF